MGDSKIISFVLTISILLGLVSCVEEKDNQINKPAQIEEFVEEEILATSPSEMIVIESSDETIKAPVAPVVIQSGLSYWLNELNKIVPEYKYSEYYLTENHIQDVIDAANTSVECQNTEMFTYEELANKIINNSQNYATSAFNYWDSISVERYLEFHGALFRALRNIYNNVEDLSEDICNLNGLVILVDDLENALGEYFPEENKIIIDYNAVKKAYENEYPNQEKSFDEYLSRVLEHEINHVRQFICSCRETGGQQTDSIRFIFENVNGSEYVSFHTILEASAESFIYSNNIRNFNPNYSTTDWNYPGQRIYQDFLLLLGMFKESFTIDEYYRVIFNGDLNNLYKLYELDSQEDLLMFYNILYALETNKGSTPLSIHLRKNGYDTVGEIRNEVGYEYRVDIFREVIKDLMEKINTGTLSFIESLCLYNYVKCYIAGSYNFEKDGENYIRVFDASFLEMVKSIEKIFYSYICEYYSKDLSDIESISQNSEFDLILVLLTNYESALESRWEIDNVNVFVNGLITKFPIILDMNFSYIPMPLDIDYFEDACQATLS